MSTKDCFAPMLRKGQPDDLCGMKERLLSVESKRFIDVDGWVRQRIAREMISRWTVSFR